MLFSNKYHICNCKVPKRHVNKLVMQLQYGVIAAYMSWLKHSVKN